jgi:septation ring formation regulator EzrA
MAESILAVDSRAIQHSLTILEDRYQQLREIGERRFEAWEKQEAELKQQLAAQAETQQQAQTARDRLAATLQALEAELEALKAERDGLVAGLHRLRTR